MEKPPALIPKEDPYAFTLKQTVFVDLAVLPKDVRRYGPTSPGLSCPAETCHAMLCRAVPCAVPPGPGLPCMLRPAVSRLVLMTCAAPSLPCPHPALMTNPFY